MTRSLKLAGVELEPRQRLPTSGSEPVADAWWPSGHGHAVLDEGWPEGYTGPAVALCGEHVIVISDLQWVDLGPHSCQTCAARAADGSGR